MDLNRAMIIGNVTRDPEVRNTPSGHSVASFGVATTHRWTDGAGTRQEKTEFHNVIAWGKLAEICGQYLGKGRKVFIEGRMQTREWEGQDGNRRQRTEIVAENMIMLERNQAPGTFNRPADGNGFGVPMNTGFQPQAPAAQRPAMPNMAPPAANPPAEDEIRIEDIPF